MANIPTPCCRLINSTYTFVEELGRGAFATTYLVLHNGTKERLACKSIRLFDLSTPERVRREVQIMHHLTGHPNIVELRDVVQEKEAVHLVMELCEGGHLFQRGRRRHEEGEAKELFRHIAKAVHYCHDLGVMHGDLSPYNLLFATKENDSLLKIVDFGLSTFLEPGETFKTFSGTDIWNAGVILYFLLAGYLPYRQASKKGAYAAIDYTNSPWSSLSNDAKDLVKRMLHTDPKQQISAAEILNHPWIREDPNPSDGPMEITVIKRMKHFQAMNKFKREALKVIAQTLSEEEITGLKLIFNSIDSGNSGKITTEELVNGMRKRGQNLSDSDAMLLMDSIDLDGDGSIKLIEFVAATMHLSMIEGKDRLQKAFLHFDKDMKGYITMKEVEGTLKKCNMADQIMIKEMIEEFGNNQEEIDYDAFVAMMRKNN